MRHDPHSYADLTQARTVHLDLELDVRMDARVLEGRGTLTFAEPASGPVDLDTRGLEILEVRDATGPVGFTLHPADPVLGSRLTLQLERATPTVTLTWRTSPDASALMWLDPAQTAGTRPFLLSQCQAIHARSIAPLQDTPAARIRYDARLRVPDGLTAVMSAAPGVARDGWLAFAMPQPIPPYLLAFAVGDLASRDLGPRTRVWAEPATLEAAAWEFADAESMLETAESLFGPYAWDRYDFVVLPPSFPLGGMENPRMTFLTPTLLAGDRSLVGVLAHELAHSWTGNLVTNATNEDFWLNEGWTVWAERRIVEVLYGEEEARQQCVLGRLGLEAVMEARTRGGRRTALVYDQAGLDPDAEFSRVPYEKGFLLVTALERAVGRPRFDAFVADYIATFRFRSISTATFLDFVRERLPDAGVDLDAWTTEDGLPADAPTFRSERLEALERIAREGGDLTEARTTTEKLWVLARLPSSVDAREAAGQLGIDALSNAELRASWLALAVRTGARGLEDQLRGFLDTVGRTKLLEPVYAAMVARDDLLPLARELYAANAPRLHGSTRLKLKALGL
ncbi:MAG: leukotriene A4 hydrolase C-terminal domain-containing protein [Alphaproteobacteria bacterium]|nr:leukotriene A4 hydrolase C-terminal domain-containing protein [Alphaproteobacteria bacterium]MCB9672769.1 leukotriene A4 hydrolase C-terminal domain-containing protein [Alphaproteobacteria bacterium]